MIINLILFSPDKRSLKCELFGINFDPHKNEDET